MKSRNGCAISLFRFGVRLGPLKKRFQYRTLKTTFGWGMTREGTLREGGKFEWYSKSPGWISHAQCREWFRLDEGLYQCVGLCEKCVKLVCSLSSVRLARDSNLTWVLIFTCTHLHRSCAPSAPPMLTFAQSNSHNFWCAWGKV